MATEAGIPTSSMGKIARWFAAKRAAGQVVQPWEAEAMYEGEMNSLANTANSRRALSLQATRDAEAVKQNAINNRLREDEIDAAKQGQLTGALTQAATTGAGLYLLGGKKNGGDAVKPAVDAVNGIKPGTADASLQPGTTPPGTFDATMEGWNPLKNTGKPTNWTVGEPVNSTGRAVEAGIGEEALGVTGGESGVSLSGAGAGEEAMSGMTGASGAGTALSTVGGAISTAMPYVAAAKIGMPILGRFLEKNTPGEEGSSNVFQQAARITKDDYMRPMEALTETVTGNKPPEIAEAVLNPGGYLMKKAGKSCVVISFLYGGESPQVRVAKVFCAKCMTPERLIGYYQIGRVVIRILTKFPGLKGLVQRKLADPFIRYMKWKTGHGQRVSWKVWAFSRTFLSLCRIRFYFGKLNFFPPGAEHCVNSAADDENRWYWMDFIQKHREV